MLQFMVYVRSGSSRASLTAGSQQRGWPAATASRLLWLHGDEISQPPSLTTSTSILYAAYLGSGYRPSSLLQIGFPWLITLVRRFVAPIHPRQRAHRISKHLLQVALSTCSDKPRLACFYSYRSKCFRCGFLAIGFHFRAFVGSVAEPTS
ncbi:hypothetical protein EJ06DRAFT_169960 [Trichodelitschia bisporula]|uniref:Uncharacterized protein n=1 Tax=Trichodelitschia bisporula TaxID=703511 RepID=A0A6G1HMQ8_9PEZI|nr:hypothetical protein EJ06DRAFT_169960 [Trichodelitschia bisporula]